MLPSAGDSAWLPALQGFYRCTLDALTGAQNERLWFKTQLKLCGLWFGHREFSKAAKILKELHRCASSEFERVLCQ